MNASERQPVRVKGVIAHHKAEIPMGRPEGTPKVTLLVNLSSGGAEQDLVPHRYTARGKAAQAVFDRLFMQSLLKTGTPVVITYSPDQPTSRIEEGLVMDSISVPGKPGEENVLIDLNRSKENIS